MSFEVAADRYDRYIGRYSRPLGPRLIEFAGVTAGPVLDVGCGPGSLTLALAERFGASNVAGIDTSEAFVGAARQRVPGADIRRASAEALPFADHTFQAALSQLVLSFVAVPARMAREMARVVAAGGVVAACTFESKGFALVKTFWDAALRFDPAAPDDASLPFRTLSELVLLFGQAGFRDVETDVIEVSADYADFADLWAPFAFGIGPAGSYFLAQPEDRRQRIRDAYFELLGAPNGAFTLPARVIAVRGRV